MAQTTAPETGDHLDFAKATVELAYHCKIAADEAFIRRRAPPTDIAERLKEDCNPLRHDGRFDCKDLRARLPEPHATAFEKRCGAVARQQAKPDEAFRAVVFELYAGAFATLGENVTEPPDPARLRSDMLAKDVEFRTELLAIGEDFWGGSLTSAPSIPPLHLTAMTSLLNQLEILAKEVREIEGRLGDMALQGLELSAQAAVAEGEIRGTLPSSDRIAILRRQAEQRVSVAATQIRLVQERQKQIEKEQTQLSAQIDAQSAQINKMLVSAVGSYLGVPAELQSVANGGKVEDAFRSYVASQAGPLLADKEILASFGSISESAALYAERVQEVRQEIEGTVRRVEEVRGHIERGKRYAEDFKAIVRQPTAEGLARIGMRVLELPGSDGAALRRSFCELVDRQKPVAALLEQARLPGAVSDRIRDGIIEGLRHLPSVNARLGDHVGELVTAIAPARRAAWLADLLQRSGSLQFPSDRADAVKTELARIAAELWPRTLIGRLPDHHHAQLLKELGARLGIGSEEELVDRIREVAVPRLTVRLDQITLTVGASVYPVAAWPDMARLVAAAPGFEVAAADVQVRLETAVARLLREDALRDTIAKEIMRQIPFGTLEREVESLRGRAQETKQVWDRALASAGETIGADCAVPKGGAVERLVQMQVGSRTAVEVAEARGAAVRLDAAAPTAAPAPVPPTAPGGGGAGQSGALEREIALQALNAAFPPAGAVAGLAIKVFGSMQETKELGRMMRERTEESNRLLQTEMQLQATIEAARVAVEVNRLDGELSEIKRAAALAQYDALTRASQTAGTQTLAGLAMIQRRQPLIFYLAERLREEYDMLDRAIALWGPAGQTVRDTIRRLIEEDPRNFRLALDSDIHLFQWLDRSEERVRTDIDRIVGHWRQLHRLVSDLCDRIGCQPGQSRLGHVQQSAMIDVCALMAPSDCRQFRHWLREGAGAGRQGPDMFSTQLIFPSDAGYVPRHLLNVRVVDVRLGGYARPAEHGAGGELLRVNSFQLLHPGVSFIRQPNGYAREALGPGETGTFDWPEPFDLEALGTRWNRGARTSRRFFEGYGLLTTWRLLVTRSPALDRLDTDAEAADGVRLPGDLKSGVFIRFAYSYHLPPPDGAADAVFVSLPDRRQQPDLRQRPAIRIDSRARPDLRTLEVPSALLMLIGDSAAYAEAQARWRDRTPGDTPTLASCDAPPDAAGRGGFAERVCLERISGVEQDALVREQTRALMRRCIGESASITRPKAADRLREIDHVIASRYGHVFTAAAALTRSELDGEPVTVSACGRPFTSSFALCEFLGEPEAAGCRR